MMEPNCTLVDFEFTQKFLPTVYVSVFILGLVGNCFGLRSIYKNWRKMGNVNIFVLNLCLADILYLFTLPCFVVYYASSSQWKFGDSVCKILRFCFSINLYGSIGFLTCISVYRYLGIVHTLKVKGRITVWHSTLTVSVVWVLVSVQSLPDLFFVKTSSNKSECYDTTSGQHISSYLKYSIAKTVLGFGIPLLTMLCCYGHVAMALISGKDTDVLLKLRCLRLVVVLTLLFCVCFIPYHVFRNLNLATRISKMGGTCLAWYSNIYTANQIGHGLACMNSAINPLVYLFNSDELLIKCFVKCGRGRKTPVDLSEADSPLREYNQGRGER